MKIHQNVFLLFLCDFYCVVSGILVKKKKHNRIMLCYKQVKMLLFPLDYLGSNCERWCQKPFSDSAVS